MSILFITLLGASIGISSALLGLGGNILIVPLLPLLKDIPLNETIATGIFTVFFLTLFNCYFFFRKKLIDLAISFKLIVPTFLFSFIASKYSSYFSEQTVTWLLISVMLLMILRLNIDLKFSNDDNATRKNVILITAGIISGFLAGLTGVGNGVILAPVLLGFKLVEDEKVSPTINFMIMISCFSATINNLDFHQLNFEKSGLVRIETAFYILIPALVSSFIGRKLNTTVSKTLRRRLVTIALIGLSLKLYFL